eukprot:gene8274-14230_t
MARQEDLELGNTDQPRKVKLKRRNQSFGFKVRGQTVRGGPRWLINGHEYRNLQTVSDVLPESPAEECGVLPGDRILSINSIEMEDVDHDEFREVMKTAGEEVELVIVTPSEVKMLDIPSSVVIHKTDGSVLTINDTELLRTHTIDEALHSEIDNTGKLEVQVHKPQEQESEKVDQNLIDSISDNLPQADSSVDENDTRCDSLSDKESLSISEASGNLIVNELQDENPSEENCHKDEVIIQQEDSENESVKISNGEDKIDESVKEDAKDCENADVPMFEQNDEIIDCFSAEAVSNTSFDIIEASSDDEVGPNDHGDCISFVESFTSNDGFKGVNDWEHTREGSSITNEAENFTRDCSAVTLKRKGIIKSPEREVEDIQNQMKLMLSTMRHQKVRPFSPDIISNLSPYHNNKCIRDGKHTRRSWSFSQRPTSLSVLHPSEALRLERSSNLAKKRKAGSVPSECLPGSLSGSFTLEIWLEMNTYSKMNMTVKSSAA